MSASGLIINMQIVECPLKVQRQMLKMRAVSTESAHNQWSTLYVPYPSRDMEVTLLLNHVL